MNTWAFFKVYLINSKNSKLLYSLLFTRHDPWDWGNIDTWTRHKLKDAKACHLVANCQLCNPGRKSPCRQRWGLKHTQYFWHLKPDPNSLDRFRVFLTSTASHRIEGQKELTLKKKPPSYNINFQCHEEIQHTLFCVMFLWIINTVPQSQKGK